MDSQLRQHTGIDHYIATVRAGLDEPWPRLVRITRIKKLRTARGKRFTRIFFTSYGGATIRINYWDHSYWFQQRLEHLSMALGDPLVPGQPPDTWFWLERIMKVSRRDTQFWDYRAHTEIPEQYLC